MEICDDLGDDLGDAARQAELVRRLQALVPEDNGFRIGAVNLGANPQAARPPAAPVKPRLVRQRHVNNPRRLNLLGPLG